MNTIYEPNFATPPGETLAETLECIGMSQADLAGRMGRPLKTINEIISGKARVTSDTALQLEKVLGVPAAFWSNRERLYRDALARQREAEDLEKQLDWLKTLPVNALVRAGWIAKCGDPVGQLRRVLGFFGVAGVEEYGAVWEGPQAAFRRSPAWPTNPGATAAWLRKGEMEAQRVETLPYDPESFVAVLREVRALTVLDPTQAVPNMQDLCAKAGVAVVVVQPLPGMRANGAARWLNSSKALIQLSLRGKADDHLWFTFYHEAGHIYKHGKRAGFLDQPGADDDRFEREADVFAQEFLLPPADYGRFCCAADFSPAAILHFAATVGIAPGIVVGRLQHDRKLPFNAGVNKLKRPLAFVD